MIDVVVKGVGMSGIACARALHAAGLIFGYKKSWLQPFKTKKRLMLVWCCGTIQHLA